MSAPPIITDSILPRVYTLGFHAGQAIHSFLQDKATMWSTFNEESLPHLWSMITNFPIWYSAWWMDLLKNDPVHVFVETTLLLSVLYMIVSRTKDWSELKKDQLTTQEEDELIREWKKARAPLSPSYKEVPCAMDVPDIVVHKVEGTSMIVSMDKDEKTKYKVKNFGTFDFLGMSAEFTTHLNGNGLNPPGVIAENNGNSNNDNAAAADDDGAQNKENGSVAANENPEQETATSSKANKKKKKKKKKNNDKNNANGGGGFQVSKNNSAMKDASVEALERYGVGACGPRGFYGTVDPHLQLEKEFTEFMGSDGAILYSDGASTVSSTVAAFCKRGDLLVVDEGVYEPLIAGIKLSRAYVKWYKHNDMRDLRRVLESVRDNDKKLGRAPKAQRRFIICEGLYRNTGQIAPLDKIVEMKHEFHYRLILDESYSFGTLGPTGKGALELFDKRLTYDAEIVTIALENALGSIGGMTIGNEEIVDHQRLSGSGYCFSAASPPFTASAAIQALRKLKNEPESMLSKLNENKQYLYDKLHAFSHSQEDLILISSDIRSPILFLVLAECPETEDIDATVFLSEVVRECTRRGLGAVSAGQHNSRAGTQLLRKEPPPSIRLSVSAAHTKEDIDFAVKVLSDSLGIVMNRYIEGQI